MESTNSTTTDHQTPPIIPLNNSSSRRKQSKPNRLEHVVLDNPSAVAVTCDSQSSSSVLPSITQYHVAAEQQDIGIGDDDCDRISLNCEDGSLSSHSTGEHYAMEDIINRSRRPHQQQSRSNLTDETMLSEENEQQQQIDNDDERAIGALDFSIKMDETNEHLLNSTNRSRSLNTSSKSRSLKRKHPNGNIDNGGTVSMPTRIFHADAFCGICRKEFCNKYFLKTHLANKHGIFDHQSIAPSVSTSTIPSLLTSSKEMTDTNNELNNSDVQHPFTVISALLNNVHDDLSSSSPSLSSDMIQNHQNNNDENETELSSLRHQMNGVIAGDDDDNNNNPSHNEDQNNDDEQDGINSNSLINLPQQIASILCNDNTNYNNIKSDDDQRTITTNSPTNSLDFQQQLGVTTTGLLRQSSTKLIEDFCDICQKHFCNKYYLRKHRLDVHGVQTDCNIKPYKRLDNNCLSSKNSPPSTSTQQMSPFSNVTFNSSSVQQNLGMLLNPIFSPLVQSQTSNDQQTLSTNKRRYTDSSNESSSSKSQFPSSLLNVSSDVANIFANQLVTVTNNNNNNSISTSKSLISTCHLCGKKFQSNDYLQLHLMNKHQLKTDLQNFDLQQRTTNKMSNLIQTSNGSLNNNTFKKIKLEPNETITTVMKAHSPADTIPSPNTSTVISGIVDTYFAAKMADRVSCDICHKQVCNKYFLKTHKLKVHGVGPDPLLNSSISSNNNELSEDKNEQQQSMDNSPPQLVVDEMNTTSTEPGSIPSPDALTASVNTFIGTNNELNEQSSSLSSIICDLCSKTFPSKFLLHIHITNVHGIQQSSSLTNGTSTITVAAAATTTTAVNNNNNQLINNGMKRPLTNENNPIRLKQTPQVQLRVTCQVCKKELCNKYFLRAHMRNVHNISIDDFRITQQPSTSQLSPSSDQQTFSLSSNILSPRSSIATDIHLKRSLSNDNDMNHSNGHIIDSSESDNINNNNISSSVTTTTNDNNNNNRFLSMQPFLVESDDDLYKDLFVPCMVYLPCRHRVTKPLEISLRLKPVDNKTPTPTLSTTITD